MQSGFQVCKSRRHVRHGSVNRVRDHLRVRRRISLQVPRHDYVHKRRHGHQSRHSPRPSTRLGRRRRQVLALRPGDHVLRIHRPHADVHLGKEKDTDVPLGLELRAQGEKQRDGRVRGLYVPVIALHVTRHRLCALVGQRPTSMGGQVGPQFAHDVRGARPHPPLVAVALLPVQMWRGLWPTRVSHVSEVDGRGDESGAGWGGGGTYKSQRKKDGSKTCMPLAFNFANCQTKNKHSLNNLKQQPS
jgi:hypothetical protein